MKPFEALKVDELRQDLEARGVADPSMTKPILRICLAEEEKSGADLHGVVIQLFLLLTDLDSKTLLLHTIV